MTRTELEPVREEAPRLVERHEVDGAERALRQLAGLLLEIAQDNTRKGVGVVDSTEQGGGDENSNRRFKK